MTCPYCGAENEAGFQFCKTCGAKLTPKAAPQQYQVPQQPQYQAPQYQAPQQPQYQAPQYQAPQQPQYRAPQAPVSVAPQQPKKTPLDDIIAKVKGFDFKALLKEPKKLIIPAAAVAAVLVLIILISVIASAGGDAVTPKMTYHFVEVDDEYMLLCDDKIIEEGLEDAYIVSKSMDGTVALYNSDDELFAIQGKKSVSITDEYNTAVLSVNGAYVAIVDYDDVLTVYNTKNGEATEIAEDVEAFSMSPDGKTIVYAVDDDGDYVTYLYKGKDPIELGENLYPITVSNGGKLIYCVDAEKDNLVTVDAKGNTEKIAGDPNSSRFFLNEDHTQIIFQADGKWYASVKGGEKIKLTSDSSFFFLNYQYGASHVTVLDYSSYIITYPTSDLRSHYVVLDDNVSWMNNKWELTKAAKDVEEAYVSADGKTLVYLKDNGKLQKVTSKKLDDPVDLAEDVYSFMPVSDCSAVYYINEDEELIFQKGTKEGKRVGDDVEGILMTHDDYCFFGADEEIYSTKNGGKKVLISDEIDDIYITATVVVIWTDYDDGDYNISVTTKGNKFKPIYEY